MPNGKAAFNNAFNTGFLDQITINKRKKTVSFRAGEDALITAKVGSTELTVVEYHGATQKTVELDTPLESEILDPEQLEDVFWDWINPQLEDPFLRDSDLEEKQELCFSDHISHDDAHRLFHAIVLTDRKSHRPDVSLYINAAANDDAAEYQQEPDWLSATTKTLLEKAIEYCAPEGWEWEYNDGARDRQSGYYRSPTCVFSFSNDEDISAHEKAELMRFLREWAKSQGPWDAAVCKALNLDDDSAAVSKRSSNVKKGAA